ncbi:hypothetical protein VE03_10519, partial [Pseudogymnoascus sp. 23342-1-I1]
MVIIAGFPGVGKSNCASDQSHIDADSASYSWEIGEDGETKKNEAGAKIQNRYWPSNYIDYILSFDKSQFIFVSTHEEIRNALIDRHIQFTLVYPNVSLKGAYLERYRARGSSKTFVDFMDKNWDSFITQLTNLDNA